MWNFGSFLSLDLSWNRLIWLEAFVMIWFCSWLGRSWPEFEYWKMILFLLEFSEGKKLEIFVLFFFFFFFRWISNVASFNYVKTMWCWCVREKVMLLWSCINYLSSVISTVKILNYRIVKSMWFWCVRGKSINYLPSVISTIKILNYWIVLCG